jgi:hypothetical protein
MILVEVLAIGRALLTSPASCPASFMSCCPCASFYLFSFSFRIQTVDKTGSRPVSLWHDVTLVHVDPKTDRPTPYLNFVCEIPKFSRKKFEIATDEIGNLIKQDEKKGVLREFKKGDIFFNYGCLPVSVFPSCRFRIRIFIYLILKCIVYNSAHGKIPPMCILLMQKAVLVITILSMFVKLDSVL